MQPKIIFITGISSGIGRAAAQEFLKSGHFVIGTVRDEISVQDFIKNYSEQFMFLKIDLKNLDSISEVPKLLKQKKIEKIDILINNAGVAVAGPFEFQNFFEVQEIIQLNVLALMRMTQVLISYLRMSEDGRVINISSVAGQNGTPFLAAYCASKHAVEGFSESLRREMNLYNIKVIVIGPGSVKTPIWDKGFEQIKFLYASTPFSKSFEKFIRFAMNEKNKGLDVDVVVRDILHAVNNKKPKIRYAPVPRKLMNYRLPKLVPTCFMDYLTCQLLGLNFAVKCRKNGGS